jgi:uncharacterized protein with GYD domain
MITGSYTPEGLAGTLREGLTARNAVVARAAESLGGTLLGMYWTTSVNDSVVLVEFDDAAGAVALATAVKAAGAAQMSIVRLFDAAEFDAVTAATSALQYRPPTHTAG